MKTYVEPECQMMILDEGYVICSSPGAAFDPVNATELFTVEDFELI